MDTKRLAIGSVVGAIALTAAGFLFYEVIFGAFFEGQMLSTPRDPYAIWAMVVGGLAQSLLVALAIGWSGTGSVMGGLQTGALVSFLMWFAADLVLYGIYESAMLSGALADAVLSGVTGGIAGAAIGAVSGKGGKEAAATAA